MERSTQTSDATAMVEFEPNAKITQLTAVFRNSWTNIFLSQFTSVESLRDWQRFWTRVTRDLAEEQIRLAIKKSVFLCEFPPSPAQFRKYAFDLPSPTAAFALAVDFMVNKSSITNEIIYECAKKISSFDWSSLSEKDLKAKFIAIYERVSEEYLLGDGGNG